MIREILRAQQEQTKKTADAAAAKQTQQEEEEKARQANLLASKTEIENEGRRVKQDVEAILQVQQTAIAKANADTERMQAQIKGDLVGASGPLERRRDIANNVQYLSSMRFQVRRYEEAAAELRIKIQRAQQRVQSLEARQNALRKRIDEERRAADPDSAKAAQAAVQAVPTPQQVVQTDATDECGMSSEVPQMDTACRQLVVAVTNFWKETMHATDVDVVMHLTTDKSTNKTTHNPCYVRAIKTNSTDFSGKFEWLYEGRIHKSDKNEWQPHGYGTLVVIGAPASSSSAASSSPSSTTGGKSVAGNTSQQADVKAAAAAATAAAPAPAAAAEAAAPAAAAAAAAALDRVVRLRGMWKQGVLNNGIGETWRTFDDAQRKQPDMVRIGTVEGKIQASKFVCDLPDATDQDITFANNAVTKGTPTSKVTESVSTDAGFMQFVQIGNRMYLRYQPRQTDQKTVAAYRWEWFSDNSDQPVTVCVGTDISVAPSAAPPPPTATTRGGGLFGLFSSSTAQVQQPATLTIFDYDVGTGTRAQINSKGEGTVQWLLDRKLLYTSQNQGSMLCGLPHGKHDIAFGQMQAFYGHCVNGCPAFGYRRNGASAFWGTFIGSSSADFANTWYNDTNSGVVYTTENAVASYRYFRRKLLRKHVDDETHFNLAVAEAIKGAKMAGEVGLKDLPPAVFVDFVSAPATPNCAGGSATLTAGGDTMVTLGGGAGKDGNSAAPAVYAPTLQGVQATLPVLPANGSPVATDLGHGQRQVLGQGQVPGQGQMPGQVQVQGQVPGQGGVLSASVGAVLGAVPGTVSAAVAVQQPGTAAAGQPAIVQTAQTGLGPGPGPGQGPGQGPGTGPGQGQGREWDGGISAEWLQEARVRVAELCAQLEGLQTGEISRLLQDELGERAVQYAGAFADVLKKKRVCGPGLLRPMARKLATALDAAFGDQPRGRCMAQLAAWFRFEC
jgi:hypothetical protein